MRLQVQKCCFPKKSSLEKVCTGLQRESPKWKFWLPPRAGAWKMKTLKSIKNELKMEGAKNAQTLHWHMFEHHFGDSFETNIDPQKKSCTLTAARAILRFVVVCTPPKFPRREATKKKRMWKILRNYIKKNRQHSNWFCASRSRTVISSLFEKIERRLEPQGGWHPKGVNNNIYIYI